MKELIASAMVLAALIVNLSVMGTASAQDRTWKECELADHELSAALRPALGY